MNNAYLSGYRKKNITQLLRAIDDCTTLSQLFALIQHEQIEVQMHAQSGASNVIRIPMHAQTGASNLTPKKLEPKLLVDTGESPFDRFKAEVVRALIEQGN